MPNQLNNKTFKYSSERTKKICDGLLSVHREVERCTESGQIENAILKAYLPSNKFASTLVEQVYAGELTLAEAYKILCRNMSAPLTHEFLLNAKTKLLLDAITDSFSSDPKLAPISQEHLQRIIQYLAQLTPHIEGSANIEIYNIHIQFIKENPSEINPLVIVRLLARNWDNIRLKYETYTILSQLIDASPDSFYDTLPDRYRFLSLTKGIFDE